MTPQNNFTGSEVLKNSLIRRNHGIGKENYNFKKRCPQKIPGYGPVNVFRGATSKRLNHYILPMLHQDQPDVALLRIGSNDVSNQTKDKINKPLGTNGPPDVFSVLTPFDLLTAHKIDILIKQLLCQFEGLLVF